MENDKTAAAGFKIIGKIGTIPDDWDVVRLDEVASVNCNTLSERTPDDYKFRYIDLSSVDNGQIIMPDHLIRFGEAPSRARRLAMKGDVVMATVRPYLHGFARLHFEPKDMVFSTGFAIISPNDLSDTEFIYQTLYSTTIARQLYGFLVGTNYPAINSGDVEALHIAFPSSGHERQIIGEILSVWDIAIEYHETLINRKQLLKKALMQQLLTGKRRFKKFINSTEYYTTKFGKIPCDWRIFKIKDLFKRVMRRNSTDVKRVLTASGKHGLVDQLDFFNRSVAGEILSKYYLLKRGEFAYNRSLMNGYPYGAIKRLDEYEEGALSTLYLPFAVNNKECDSDFLKHFFEAGLLNRQLRMIAQMGARAHGLLNVTVSDFFELEIPLPTKREQTQIARVFNATDHEIDLLGKQLDLVRKQKCGLMQRLLTGNIRVKIQ